MATVSDGTGSKLVCRIGDYRGFHSDIACELQEELADFTVLFQGGGTLLFQLGDTNSVRIGDSSEDYGPDRDPNQTRELLQAAFPDYEIEIRGEL
ncbi:MAG: hypothetical protein KBB55_00635 [Candidatus Buchananbacteria bacterium]|nr:hypothetical protein [Candidatus Buchananbacteria bacterium]